MRCAGRSSTPARSRPGPDLVGLSGQSSGGHLAMLVAMRPHDPRYAAIPLPAGSPAHDATVRCVVMSWPVINPFSRYRLAKRDAGRRQSAGMAEVASSRARTPTGAAKPTWRRATRCSRSSAARRCSRRRRSGSRAAATSLHDYKDEEGSFPGNEPQRFVANYRKAGGEIALEYIDAERHAGHSPDLSKTGDMFERMVAWVGRHIRVGR